MVGNKRTKYLCLLVVSVLLFLVKDSLARVSESLFFQGEDLDVLSIASGRPEFPANAPAIAQVISTNHLDTRMTLAEVLSQEPGFYLAQKEWGHQLFLRGVPSGILFLYDSVPLRSDSTKNIYPLDFELSLASIKKVEVVRGPASVLWGPDAFVGVLNLVPKTGKDLNGMEWGISGGSEHYKSGFVNLGKDFGWWDVFLSLGVTYINPANNVYLDALAQDQSLPSQRYYHGVFNLNFVDSLNISGRFSYYDKPYVMSDLASGLKWDAKKNNPFNLIKVAWKKDLTDSLSFSLKSYYNYFYEKKEEMDVKWQQKNYIYYFESLLNKDFLQRRGLLTLGASYRINRVKDADIQTRTFLPDYIQHKDNHFKMLIDQASFNTRLFSLFAQYRHHLERVDLWAGSRFDLHSEYHKYLSYNLGLLWNYNDNCYLKAIYGTAYRTPYATQFLGDKSTHPEEVKTLNLELTYHHDKRFRLSLIPFYNVISHHINEDPYGGYSLPDEQNFLGLETTFSYHFNDHVSFWLNTTWFKNWGDKENYRVLDYITISPSGDTEKHYTSWQKDYNYGANKILNTGLSYQSKSLDVFLRMNYVGGQKFTYKDKSYSFAPATTFDCSFKMKNWLKGLDFWIKIKNIFNHQYETPGTFSPIQADGRKLYAGIKYVF